MSKFSSFIKSNTLNGFINEVKTIDGYGILIGGFCSHRSNELVEEILIMELRKEEFGNYTDPYAVDARFAQMIRYAVMKNKKQLVKAGLCALAAVIKVPEAKDACGAIIGKPFDEIDSANEEGSLELICNAYLPLYMIAYPGKLGAVIACENKKIYQLQDQVSRELYNKHISKENIERTIGIIKRYSKTFIIVTDFIKTSDINKTTLYLSIENKVKQLTL